MGLQNVTARPEIEAAVGHVVVITLGPAGSIRHLPTTPIDQAGKYGNSAAGGSPAFVHTVRSKGWY
jgi:hypothetical protein